jgi:hypothetical protein
LHDRADVTVGYTFNSHNIRAPFNSNSKLQIYISTIIHVKYASIDSILQAFVFFRFVDIIDITIHDRFWNVGQANCILKYFENMMIDHPDSTIF